MATSKTPETQAEPPEMRVDYWRRVLARGAGKNPSAKIKLAISRAATWSAEAVRVAADPAASTNAKVRSDSTARTARRDLAALIEADKPAAPKLGPNSLKEYAAKYRVPA